MQKSFTMNVVKLFKKSYPRVTVTLKKVTFWLYWNTTNGLVLVGGVRHSVSRLLSVQLLAGLGRQLLSGMLLQVL